MLRLPDAGPPRPLAGSGVAALCGSGARRRPIRPRPEAQLTPAVILGSLLAVALWEFCRPRRQREFPALRRRFGNVGIWLLNIVLAAFIFAPTDTFRPQLAAVLGVSLPVWPIADRWASFAAAFLLLDFLNYAMHRCQH